MGQSESQGVALDEKDADTAELDELKTHSEAQSKEIESILNKKKDNAKELNSLKSKSKDQTSSIKGSLLQQLDEIKLRLRRQTQELQIMKAEKEAQKEEIAEIKTETEEKLQVLEEALAKKKDAQSIQEAALIWKVDKFGQLNKTAKKGKHKAIHSLPFYTARYGYKMKLRLHPNGHEDGKGTHISTYIILMKGEYDALLPWPFTKNVSVSVIDQQDDPTERENITALYKAAAEDENNCFARPMTEENNPFGDALMASQEDLRDKRKYIVDDTVFLLVTIQDP